jgi:serine/threonine-protein phosphatase 2A regulatory subunit B
VESAKECFNAVNIQPSNISDLSEVITSASFHPALCNLLLYSTSLGAVHLCDLRDSALLKSGSVSGCRRRRRLIARR